MPPATLAEAREELTEERRHELRLLDETREKLLRELWVLLRHRRQIGKLLPASAFEYEGSPQQPGALKRKNEAQELFVKRFKPFTDIPPLRELENVVAPLIEVQKLPKSLGTVSMPPPRVVPPTPTPIYRPPVPAPTTKYPLPPPDLNPAWNREKNPAKQWRKRDKSKRDDKERDKDKFQSMDFSRWVATIKTNPVYTHLTRKPLSGTRHDTSPLVTRPDITKVVSTNDWFIAIREVKLLRLQSKVENLIEQGRWAYRQPKRNKEPVEYLPKTHWDWLREESRWMWEDFRQERVFKYHIGAAIGRELKQRFAEKEEAAQMEVLKQDEMGNVSAGKRSSEKTSDHSLFGDEDADVDIMGDIDDEPFLESSASQPTAHSHNTRSKHLRIHQLDDGPEKSPIETVNTVEDVAAILEAHEANTKLHDVPEDDDYIPGFDPEPVKLSDNVRIGSSEREDDQAEDMDVDIDGDGEDETVEEDLKLDIPELGDSEGVEKPEVEDTGGAQTGGEPQLEVVMKAEEDPSNIIPPERPPGLNTYADPRKPLAEFGTEDDKGVPLAPAKNAKGEPVKLHPRVKDELRDAILGLDSDATFFDPLSLPSASLHKDKLSELEELFPQLTVKETVSAIFPDLIPYSPFVAAAANTPLATSSASTSTSNSPIVPVVSLHATTSSSPNPVGLKLNKKEAAQRRTDELGLYAKTVPLSRFMKGKGLLVSALQPAKNLTTVRLGNETLQRWSFEDDVIAAKPKEKKEREASPSSMLTFKENIPEEGCSLFAGKRFAQNPWPTPTTMVYYQYPKSNVFKTPLQLQAGAARGHNSENGDNAKVVPMSAASFAIAQIPPYFQSKSSRPPMCPWARCEDELLRLLVQEYGNNWGLIHDLFKSSRKTRSDGECQRTLWGLVERWGYLMGINQAQTGMGIRSMAGGIVLAPPMTTQGYLGLTDKAKTNDGKDSTAGSASILTATDSQNGTEKSGMKTRGLKKRATSTSTSLAEEKEGMGSATGAATSGKAGANLPGWETQRRKRHIFLPETIRKVIKKRESSKPSPRSGRQSAAHETHLNVTSKNGKVPTPAELSKLKFEQDQRTSMEQKRNQEQKWQYHQRLIAQQMAARNAAVNGSAVNGAPAVPSIPVSVGVGVNGQMRPPQVPGQPQGTNQNTSQPHQMMNISQHAQAQAQAQVQAAQAQQQQHGQQSSQPPSQPGQQTPQPTPQPPHLPPQAGQNQPRVPIHLTPQQQQQMIRARQMQMMRPGSAAPGQQMMNGMPMPMPIPAGMNMNALRAQFPGMGNVGNAQNPNMNVTNFPIEAMRYYNSMRAHQQQVQQQVQQQQNGQQQQQGAQQQQSASQQPNGRSTPQQQAQLNGQQQNLQANPALSHLFPTH